ncbi:unextended protein-like isoform X2 [Eriocheir sinensis]|uniref:unextended protein-like isoform X2 n=1 Tax=Eriocheir sinensis TaxID=95602 RepID=UPI0021C99011|nr:unextended protein-like isoform X2 [Eriocheir sinensis]
MAAGWGWAFKHFVLCVLVCAGHVFAGRRVPVRVEAIFTSGDSHGWKANDGAVVVAGEETQLELWGSGLSRGVEVGLTAAQGVQGTPCRALVTPPLAPDPGTATHNYASYTVPASDTEPIPVEVEMELYVCTQEQHPVSSKGRTRHAGGWVHQGRNGRLLLKANPPPVHRLSLRSIDLLSSSGGRPAALPSMESSSTDEAPVTDAFLVDVAGAATLTTLADGDEQNLITTPAPSIASPDRGEEMAREPGGALAPGNSERFNSEAKTSKDSAIAVRTAADGAANDAGVPQDVMLGDAAAPPAVAGRTPDKEDANAKDLESDDVRTSGSGDSVSMGIGMGDLADDTRNLMKEGVSGSSLTQPRSPAAPRANAARDSNDQDATESSAVDMSQISISGLRVEEHEKGIYYEDLAGSVLVNTDATLRLFGRGLTVDSEVLFTAYPAEAGDMCGSHLSKAFKVEDIGAGWATVVVNLPPMSADQDRWYLCVRTSDQDTAYHQGNDPWLTMSSYNLILPLWLQGCFIGLLLVLSGLFSGLNLGLMALDKTELKIVSNTGSAEERRYARAIEPVRRHGNFLLCTLLLGNVLVNSTLTILLDGLSSGLIAVVGSTIGIVIFGEIIPQAICSRHGLAIGARTVWLVRVFMVLTGPAAYPISKILDFVLGEEIGNTYDRERLMELIKVTHDRNDLKMEEQNIICGALELHKKTVGEVMTKLDDVYMLCVDRNLDFDTINEIMQQGYSRVPVYEGERTNIMAVLFIKDLAYIDPDDNTPLRTLCQFYQNPCNFVFVDTTLDVMFKEFKEGNKGHMAFVQRVNNEGECDPFYEVLGLITLEDVIEELIQEEIVDETDVFTDNRTRRRREATGRPDFTEFSNPTNQTNHKRVQISAQLLVAALQYLRTSVEPFKEGQLSELIVKKLLNQDVIHTIKLRNKENPKADSQSYIYTQGKPVDYFVLILEGHVEVTIGKENLTFESGPFTYFGMAAVAQIQSIGESPSASTQLSKGSMLGSVQSLDATKFSFTPDYSVRAITEVVYLRVRRSHYIAARRAFLLERAQKEPHSDEHFEKEIAKMLIEDDGLSSPTWESTPLTTPHARETPGMANGSTVKACDADDIQMTFHNLLNNPPVSQTPEDAPPSTGVKNSISVPGTPVSTHNQHCVKPNSSVIDLQDTATSASSINMNPSLSEKAKPETNNLSASSVEDNDDQKVIGQSDVMPNMNSHVSLDYKPSNLDTEGVLPPKRESSFS